MTKQIPITVLTGFLGSGKTTLINKIINSDLTKKTKQKFALIINEFGEVGVDGKLIENYNEEITEISDGCICCVVQTDLVDTIQKIADRGDIDYILIETSGLAEPEPLMNTLVSINSPNLKFDSLVTVVDIDNYETFAKDYTVVDKQIALADVVVLNKSTDENQAKLQALKAKIAIMNNYCAFVVNDPNTPINIFVETNEWNLERLLGDKEDLGVKTNKTCNNHEHDHGVCTNPEHNHSDHEEQEHKEHKHHDDHTHHNHNQVDEVVWTSNKALDPNKLDFWLYNKFPVNAIRSKGILRLSTPSGISNFVFQMVGANKNLIPLSDETSQIPTQSIIVLIGKNLNKQEILESLDVVTID